MSESNAVPVTCTTSLLHSSNANGQDTQLQRFSQTRGSFDDPELERLYQSYSIKQRFSDLKCFLYTSLLFSLYSILSSFIYAITTNTKAYIDHVILISITFLLMAINFILIIWSHLSRNSWANQNSQIAPYLAWFIIVFEFFISLYIRKTMPLYLFEDLGWIFVFSYFIYVTLPLSLFYCILLTTCTCLFYLFLIIGVYRFSRSSLQQLPVNILLLLVVTFLGLINYFMQEKQKRRAFLETRRSLEVKMIIEEESNEQERLLLSVLPKHVAVQMRQNLGAVDSQFKKIYMSRHENVSILYADIVGFTAISSTYSAQDLVKILNELFARFDHLAEKFHQLRIKILGDCYYCISGAPKERSDHAVMCIHMGLSMVDAIKYVQQKTNSPVDMRVGIHTGAVLAGVLGQRQWQFDVYSKDVELANHMESSGMAGRVHISEKTLSYLNDEFEVEPGFGEKRDEILRIAGLRTFFIVKVLRPIYRENSIQEPSFEQNNRNQTDFRKRLKRELLYKDNERDFEKHIDPILLRFTDRAIEDAYYRQAGTLSRCSLPIFLFVRIVINCSHFFYLPRKMINYLSFLILLILFLISFISVLCLLKLKTCYHNRKKTWIWTMMNIMGILALGLFSINDIYICQIDNYASCKYPAFFSHTNVLELIIISQSEVLGFIGKTIAIVLFSIINSVIVGIVLNKKLDFDDSVLFATNNQTNSDIISKRLPTKYALNIMVILIAISLILLSRHWERVSRILFSWRSQVEVQREQAADMRHRNETLLYNVLPPHVATYFMKKGRILHYDELYSQSYSEIGVLFASMPNFSDFYSEETVNNQGLECLRFLNEVISDFDALLERDKFKTHITKIKTISSTYMAASGLNIDELNKPRYNSINERWLHLSVLVEFAIEMKKTLQNINEQSFNHFVLKMGINHGPVTAGVIGARKPHYDIWGNTVNVASRMESTGKAGCIQVTKECCEILENFGYRFEQRGLVHVKGKGQLMTYYLIEDVNNNSNSIAISNN